MTDDRTDREPDETVKDPSELEAEIEQARKALEDIRDVDTDIHERGIVEDAPDDKTDDDNAPG